MSAQEEPYIRPPSHQGEWYPSDVNKLTKMLQASFFYAKNQKLDNLKGIISPHCCYDVCLRTAAHSYAAINPDLYEKIVILGTCHHFPLTTCLVSPAQSVCTPYGEIEVDTETLKNLTEQYSQYFSFMTREQDEAEHSLEMQYPLIKYIFHDHSIKILPILCGSLREDFENDIAKILSPIILSEKTLFIVSTDFMHWGKIFHFNSYANERKNLSQQVSLYDERAMNIISVLGYQHFRFFIDEIHGSICGCYAICLIMHILMKGFSVTKLDRTELCKIVSPSDFTISFLSIAFCNEEEETSDKCQNHEEQDNEEQQEFQQNIDEEEDNQENFHGENEEEDIVQPPEEEEFNEPNDDVNMEN